MCHKMCFGWFSNHKIYQNRKRFLEVNYCASTNAIISWLKRQEIIPSSWDIHCLMFYSRLYWWLITPHWSWLLQAGKLNWSLNKLNTYGAMYHSYHWMGGGNIWILRSCQSPSKCRHSIQIAQCWSGYRDNYYQRL